MSMARQLMTGGYIGSLECSINPARYGHDGGALAIAMESVEELHEIFLEGYNFEQADLAAAIEGVALEGSQYEAVAEAAIKDTFKKIKDFFVKLWNKVKAFFHEVRKYLDAIFMSGKEFAKKYEKEINKLDNIKDLSVKMFTYDDAALDSVDKIADPQAAADEMNKGVVEFLAKIDAKDYENWSQDEEEALKLLIEEEKKAGEDDALVSELTSGKCKNADDYDEYLFGKFRNGATSADDKDDRDLSKSDITNFVSILINSKAMSRFDSVQSSTDKMFSRAIKDVDNAEKKIAAVKNSKPASLTAELLRQYSSNLSKLQTFQNKGINNWKTTVKERDAAYKSAIMAAFSNNRKNSKNK